jgi:hypothetical protein
VLNDVVYYNGSAYIAKQSTTGNVPTNTTYWSTFTAGSGGIWNSGLSLGSAGQVVKVNSGASALEFGDISAGLTPSAFYNLNTDSGNTNSQTWYTIGGSSIPATEIYDTDNACTNGIFTVPSGKAGTYLVNIFSTHTGSSTHGGSDGTFHRIQVSTDGGSSWSVTPTNGEYKSYYLNSPGAEMTGAFSPHIAYNLSVGNQLRAQVWSYKGASSNVVWQAGFTQGNGTGDKGGTFMQLMKIF